MLNHSVDKMAFPNIVASCFRQLVTFDRDTIWRLPVQPIQRKISRHVTGMRQNEG